jgi:hypothetical protein
VRPGRGGACPTLSAPPGTPTPSGNGARLGPRSLHAWIAHSAARRNQASPIAMGRAPPTGLWSGRQSLSVSSGTGGRRPECMSFTNPRQALCADGRRVASMMFSYVQPVSPGAVPRRRRARTEARVSAVMQRGSTSVCGTSGGSSCGWRAANCCMTSGVTLARGRACMHNVADERRQSNQIAVGNA